MCISYRQIIEVTIKNKYPLPIVYDMFNWLQGKQIFSELDLLSHCQQLKIKSDDNPKMEIRSQYDHYELLAMPFRLTNAPVAFLDLTNQVFKPYPN